MSNFFRVINYVNVRCLHSRKFKWKKFDISILYKISKRSRKNGKEILDIITKCIINWMDKHIMGNKEFVVERKSPEYNPVLAAVNNDFRRK